MVSFRGKSLENKHCVLVIHGKIICSKSLFLFMTIENQGEQKYLLTCNSAKLVALSMSIVQTSFCYTYLSNA